MHAQRLAGRLSMIAAVLVVSMLAVSLVMNFATRASRDQKLATLVERTNDLSERHFALAEQLAEVLTVVRHNSEVNTAIADENRAVLVRLEALSTELKAQAERSRAENVRLHNEILRLEKDTQLAALTAIRDFQVTHPSQEPIISPGLLETLIDRLTNPGRGRNRG